MYYFLAVPLILRLKILALDVILERTVVGTCSDAMTPAHQIVIFLFYESMTAVYNSFLFTILL